MVPLHHPHHPHTLASLVSTLKPSINLSRTYARIYHELGARVITSKLRGRKLCYKIWHKLWRRSERSERVGLKERGRCVCSKSYCGWWGWTATLSMADAMSMPMDIPYGRDDAVTTVVCAGYNCNVLQAQIIQQSLLFIF